MSRSPRRLITLLGASLLALSQLGAATAVLATHDQPSSRSGMGENMLQGLAVAWGKRNYGDGSVDLWAEVARPREGLQ